jgi:hypothetical protein
MGNVPLEQSYQRLRTMPKIAQPDTQERKAGGESGHSGDRKKGVPVGFHGKKGRSGPAPGNMNALKSGSRLNHRRLVVGELPGSMVAIKREARKYRRGLEAEVLAIKSEINLVDAHMIDTASAGTIAAGIARWLLRNRIDQMSVTDIRGCGQDIVKAKTKRDAAVRQLGLDIPPEPVSLSDYVIESSDNADRNGKSPNVSVLADRVVN